MTRRSGRDRPRGLDDPGQARPEELAPGRGADHHRARHAHVVVEGEDVDAGARERHGVAPRELGEPVEQVVRHLLPLERDRAGSAPGRAGATPPRTARRRDGACCRRRRGPRAWRSATWRGEPVRDVRPAHGREREALEVVQGAGGLQRVAARRLLRVVAPAGVARRLGDAADARVAVEGHRQAPQLRLLRGDGERDEGDVDEVVAPCSGRRQGPAVDLIEAERERDPVRDPAVERREDPAPARPPRPSSPRVLGGEPPPTSCPPPRPGPSAAALAPSRSADRRPSSEGRPAGECPGGRPWQPGRPRRRPGPHPQDRLRAGRPDRHLGDRADRDADVVPGGRPGSCRHATASATLASARARRVPILR